MFLLSFFSRFQQSDQKNGYTIEEGEGAYIILI